MSGIGAALLTMLVFGGLYIVRGGEMFSPGPLNDMKASQAIGGVRSHAETGGNCGACHVAPWNRSTMDERCMDFHADIRTQIDDPTTLHGILTVEKESFTCRECHTDHNGSQAGLTLATISDFPHEMVGYSLEGHQALSTGEAFKCGDCHGEEIAHFDSQNCQECHQQMDATYMESHRATFGRECLACHDGVDRYGESFTHDATEYPLTGKHAQADCQGCHDGARTIADLQATPKTCYECHAGDDAHEGQFGIDCGVCHTPVSWEDATFDHAMTDFPLTGKHAQVGCEDCHAEARTIADLQATPKTCYACHAGDDAHGGRLGVDCGACHTPESWEEVNFDHAMTDFPLTGKHVTVACEECHLDRIFAGTARECAACHEEPQFHLGLFASSCEDCHTTEAWSPALFNGAHTFPITHGEGLASSCRTCHADSLSTYTCYGCHEHTPQNIAEEHLDEGISNFENCINCHPTGLKDEAEEGDDD